MCEWECARSRELDLRERGQKNETRLGRREQSFSESVHRCVLMRCSRAVYALACVCLWRRMLIQQVCALWAYSSPLLALHPLSSWVSRCLWPALCQQWVLNKSMLGLVGHRANGLFAAMCSTGSPHVSEITQLPNVCSTEWNHKHRNSSPSFSSTPPPHPQKKILFFFQRCYSAPQQPRASTPTNHFYF